jgi:hypothetical protein
MATHSAPHRRSGRSVLPNRLMPLDDEPPTMKRLPAHSFLIIATAAPLMMTSRMDFHDGAPAS